MVCHRQSRRRKRQGTERLAADQQVIARSPHRAGVCVHRTQVPCDRTGRRGGQQRFPQDHGGRRRRDDPRGGQRPVYSKGGSYDRGAGRRDRRRYRQRLDPDVRDSAQIFRSDPGDRRRTLFFAGRRRGFVPQGDLQAGALYGQRGRGGLRRRREPSLQPPERGREAG